MECCDDFFSVSSNCLVNKYEQYTYIIDGIDFS